MKITVTSNKKIDRVKAEVKPKVNNAVVSQLNVEGANLNDLTDVFIPSASSGDILAFDGELWKPQTLASTQLDGGTFS